MLSEDVVWEMYTQTASGYADAIYDQRIRDAERCVSAFIAVGQVLGKTHREIAVDLTAAMEFIHRENPTFYAAWHARAGRGEL